MGVLTRFPKGSAVLFLKGSIILCLMLLYQLFSLHPSEAASGITLTPTSSDYTLGFNTSDDYSNTYVNIEDDKYSSYSQSWGVFKFDLSSVSNPQSLASAKLRLYVNATRQDDNTTPLGGVVWRYNGSRGIATGSPSSNWYTPLPGYYTGWTEVDVTNIVRDWLVNGQTNYGFVIVPFNINSDGYKDNYVLVRSRRHSDSSTWPQLILDFAPLTPGIPTGTTTPLSWSSSAGRGRVQLTWNPVADASGYRIWIWDGYQYRAFDVGNTTSWDSQEAKIYPVESSLDSYANNSQTEDLFNHIQGGLDLRDTPSKLYQKTSGTSYNNNNYTFRVSAYNAVAESPQSGAYMLTLPNRTDSTAPIGSLSINNGMTKTTSTSVSLQISGSDAAVENFTADNSDDASGVAQMSFSNDNVSWTPWETFGTTKSWILQSGPGSKTVYMKLKDNAGNVSDIISASIYMVDDTKPPEVKLTINQGAETTTSNLINLFLDATDDLTPRNDLQMRFSNNGFAWTSWVSYAATYSNWNTTFGYGATSGNGYKTVYLEVMDTNGNIGATSATIGYSTTLPTGSVSSTSGTSGTVQVGGSSIPVVFTKSAQVTANLTQSGATRARFSMDGITWSPWEVVETSRVLAFPAGDGIKTALVQYQNAYGLTSAVTQQTFVVDTTPPTVRVSTVTGATATRANNVNLLVDAQDNISTTGFAYQYSLNGGAWQNATLTNGQITVTGLSAVNTLYNISLKVMDQAGNTGIGTINLWRLL